VNRELLRSAWPSIRYGLALGLGAAFVGALALNLLVVVSYMITGLVNGSLPMRALFDWGTSPYPFWSFFLAGVLLCFLVAAVPGSLGGGAIGLSLHALAPRNASLAKLGVLIGCLVGGLAGTLSVLLAHLLFYPVLATAVVLFLGRYAYTEMVLLATGIAIVSGGWVGRWLASRESATRPRRAKQ